MKRKEIKAELKRLNDFYGGNAPIEVVIQQLGITKEEADEIMNKPAPVKRKYTKKAPPPDKLASFFHAVPLGTIKVISSVIAIIALIRSGGYVYSHFARIDIPFYAILMASMIVLVSFVTPQVLVHGFKTKNWFVAVLAFILMGTFGWFNVFVTLSGLAYARNQADYYVASGQEDIVKAKRRLIELDRSEQTALADKEREDRERESLQAQFEALAGEIGSPNYLSTRSRLNLAKDRADKVQVRLDAIDAERKELNKTKGLDSVIMKDDATKQKESSMDVAIALGMELAGPILLSFALFL